MSTTNPFEQALAATPIPDSSDPALAVLDEFCQSVKSFLKGRTSCRRQMGFVTRLGLEWRVIIKTDPRDGEEVLLRAHVPLTGFPVHLDLYEEDLKQCPNEEALRSALIEFLQEPSTREAMQYRVEKTGGS